MSSVNGLHYLVYYIIIAVYLVYILYNIKVDIVNAAPFQL